MYNKSWIYKIVLVSLDFVGYNEVITLQKGSTSILIKEMEFSPNFIGKYFIIVDASLSN